MFVPISNTPRDYAWGSDGRISELLGVAAEGGPEAELWLGAHSGSPARIDHASVDQETLDAWIDADTDAALGHLTQLPYLLKVLAAGAPLSLQVHPTKAHAAVQFAAENAAGVAIDADHRNYRDANHKPEMIVALENGFAALCGVRPADERRAIVAELGLGAEIDPDDVATTLATLLENRASDRVRELVERVVEAAAVNTVSRFAESYRWAVKLNEAYPGDPGVVISLFLNLVVLDAGQALYLPAGNLHAYLHGIGIEIMAASDNVLRGGLTPKHIDVPELLAVAETSALPIPLVSPETHGDARRYAGGSPEFELWFVNGEASVALNGPAIALNLGDTASIAGSSASMTLDRGKAVFVTADEGVLNIAATNLVLAQPQAGYVESSH